MSPEPALTHLVERAATGRAKCRGCGAAIAKDSWRIGEAVPNLFANTEDAQARHWYHPACAAYRRPEAFLQAIAGTDAAIEDRERLIAEAQLGVTHERLPRVDRAERAASGRASCRECRTAIAKDSWRLTLLFWQDGRFVPSGYVHTGCAAAYLGTTAIGDRLRHFTPDLTDADLADITAGLTAPPAQG